METKKLSEDGLVPGIVKPKINVPITPFESRASRMLKAALNHKAPLRERGALIPDDKVVLQRVQQVDEYNKVRKRSPKNSVAFSDPVVSVEHKYEPTHLDEIHDYESDDSNVHEDTNGSPEPLATTQLATPLKNNSDTATTQVSYTKDNTKKGYGGDDDDDDDIFTLARSDEIVAKEEKLIDRVAKSAPKRNYEAMHDSDEEHASDKQKTGSKESSSGGLFSSPKVAKIAPYFDDRPQERRAAEARVIQQNRARSQQLNIQRSRSVSTGKSYLQKRSSGEFSVSEKVRRLPSINLPAHDRVTELLSYKKVSSPKLGERNVMHATTETTKPLQGDSPCKTEQQMPGYFNWFTSFITNQMNKLIF